MATNLKLGSSDIKALLTTYESKQRQLQFELEQTKKIIRSFKSALPELEAAEAAQMAAIAEAATAIEEVAIPSAAAVAPAKRRGRPAKAKGSTTEKKVTKPRQKKTKKKDRSSGYRLSEYDLLVFKALEETGSAMINSEIVSFIEADQLAKGEAADADQIQTMVVRSLQKLANRRDDIRKVPFEGRGMAYALPAWLNGKGELKRKHSRK